MKRVEKEKEIESLRDSLSQAKTIFLIDYRGLKVNQVTELRKKVSDISQYRVVKNRLALKALADYSNKEVLQFIKGPTGVFYSDADPISLAKILIEFAKDNPELVFKAGVVEKTTITPEDIKELARMPGKLELIGKLLFMMNYPLTRLLMVLNAGRQNLVSVLDQVARTKG